ncbi:MAG: hypothetical protein J6Q79_04605 [Clostridia bacterium]|nr:hypothetical protein [Clostridia bacterium]
MKSIYEKIAANHSVSPEEVEREILFAITQARKNPSPTAKAFWERIDEDADIEDIIRQIVARIALVV